MNIPRDKISPIDAEKIHNLATRIVFGIADCGPTTVSNIDGKKAENTRLHGLQAKKARELIKGLIEDFLLKGY